MNNALQQSTALEVLPKIPGANPLRKPEYERFCRLRALLRPKADAYRQSGLKSKTDHDAAGNASRLERRQDVIDRIAYLTRQEDEVLQAKRARIEEFLWMAHEANVADLWETVEVEKTDKEGEPILDKDGNPVMKKIQRPRLLSDLPEDVQRTVEACTIDERGRVVPKAYSKMQANQELRKLLGIGTVTRDDGELSRLTDSELISELSRQARELGVEIDLNYRMAP